MRLASWISLCTIALTPFILSSCATTYSNEIKDTDGLLASSFNVQSRVPQRYESHIGEKVIVVSPRTHTWAAYSKQGELVRSGLATAGSDYCPDLGRGCHTSVGSYRIYSLGSPECKSSRYPLPRGGAPMPYCMFFNGNQALHGSGEVVDANASHGCVRMHVADAEWVRYNFANIGTRVVVQPY